MTGRTEMLRQLAATRRTLMYQADHLGRTLMGLAEDLKHPERDWKVNILGTLQGNGPMVDALSAKFATLRDLIKEIDCAP
jgi:hypothetical protein